VSQHFVRPEMIHSYTISRVIGVVNERAERGLAPKGRAYVDGAQAPPAHKTRSLARAVSEPHLPATRDADVRHACRPGRAREARLAPARSKIHAG
jgi:hypothetical protein